MSKPKSALHSENAGTDHQAVGESAPAVTGGMKSSLQAGTVKRAIDRTDGAESAESEAVQSAEAGSPVPSKQWYDDVIKELEEARAKALRSAAAENVREVAQGILDGDDNPTAARIVAKAFLSSDGAATSELSAEEIKTLCNRYWRPGDLDAFEDLPALIREVYERGRRAVASSEALTGETPRLDVSQWRASLEQHREQWDGRRAHQLTFKQLYELANEADVIIGQLERESAWRLAELRAIHDVLDKHGFTHHGLQLSRVIEALCEESLPSATAAAPGRSAA